MDTDLIERLRDYATDYIAGEYLEKAADALEAQAARIAALEAALKPFAWHVTTEVLFEDLPDEHVIERCGIKLGDLRAARAALEETKD